MHAWSKNYVAEFTRRDPLLIAMSNESKTYAEAASAPVHVPAEKELKTNKKGKKESMKRDPRQNKWLVFYTAWYEKNRKLIKDNNMSVADACKMAAKLYNEKKDAKPS